MVKNEWWETSEKNLSQKSNKEKSIYGWKKVEKRGKPVKTFYKKWQPQAQGKIIDIKHMDPDETSAVYKYDQVKQR